MLDTEAKETILAAQKNEVTEHFIYHELARATKAPHNREVLGRIADDELRHYHFWKRYTHEEVGPDRLKVWRYFFIARVLGLTFGLKLMERGEEQAQVTYDRVSKSLPEVRAIVADEGAHERELINLIDEERLRYIGSMVLGLNDALVELTGTLAGLTFAIQNMRLIAMAGLITGIAASLSMAASEYLSTKTEKGSQNPLKASLYTGSAYVFTVLFLIFPYLVLPNLYASLGLTMANAIVVILIFTFYVSVAQDIPFRKRFSEMALISLGIAALTFGLGFVIRIFFGIDT